VAYYAPKLAQALKDSVTGIHEAITVAQRKAANREHVKAINGRANDAESREMYALAKQLYDEARMMLKAGEDDAQDAVNQNVRFAPSDAADVLRQMLGDAFLTGSHVGAVQIGGGAKILESLTGAATGMDWDSWTPGWGKAAGLVRDSGLQDLLSSAMVTINGVTGTAMTRLGNVLADGIAAGDSVQTISSNMTDFALSDDRAFVIANTETNRAMTTATLSTYDQNGVDQWEFLSEDDACPICDDLSGQTFDTGSDSDNAPPIHPSCRCTVLPVVGGQDVSQPTLDSSADDEGE
jgi:SPP1 gp7 family putative phage head morphogenesis protein